jgi:hypothetical protein
MRIIDSWNHQASGQIDSKRRRARFGRNLLTCADDEYPGSFDRKCLRVECFSLPVNTRPFTKIMSGNFCASLYLRS